MQRLTLTRRLPVLAALLGVGALLGGCNQYEVFRVAGYEQAQFSNDADIIFVIDNSSSMQDEAEDLALNFGGFINNLTNTGEGGGGLQTDDLSDAVNNYILYTSERGRFLDYQLGVTTTTVDTSTSGDVPGAYGALTGGENQVVVDTQEDVAAAFTGNLLCEATCWQSATLPSDPNFECPAEGAPGTPPQITLEYLDCLCGFEAWEGNCGAGTEEPLESAFLSLCRASDNPPDECTDQGSPLTEGDFGSNADMLREDSTVIFVVVTDEGDYSRRLDQGESEAERYLDLMDQFDVRYRFAVIGPNYDYDANTLTCNSGGATTWASRRLQLAAEATGGFYNSIAEAGASSTDCQNSDFAQHLEDLGELLRGLQQSFPLQAYPDVETIAVYVNGENLAQGQLDTQASAEAGHEVYDGGWTYDPSENSIAFHEPDVPDYNADVEIFYKPLEGTPRTLPF